MDALEMEVCAETVRPPVSWSAKALAVGGVLALSFVVLIEYCATRDVAHGLDLVAVRAFGFEEFGGFLGTGDDIMESVTQAAMTIKEAGDRCAAMPECAGFTFKGHRSDDERGAIMFKNKWHFGKCRDWTSFKKGGQSRAACGFEYHAGYLGTGNDIDQGEMSILEAKRQCAGIPECVGFTFEGVRADDERGSVFFKNSWNFGESDAWSSFKKAPPVEFQKFDGFLGEGDDIENRTMTPSQAKDRCRELAHCVGLTFEGQLGDNDEGTVYFKDGWAFGPADSWTAFKKVPAQGPPPANKKSPPAGVEPEEAPRPDQHLSSVPYSEPPCGAGLKEVSVPQSPAEGMKGGGICAPACGTVDEPDQCPRASGSGDAQVQCAYNEGERMYCALACDDDGQCPSGAFCAMVAYPMGICVFQSDAAAVAL